MILGTSLSRRNTQRGNFSLELALVMIPFMALTLAIVDFSMPIFLKSTFTHAVREGCRFGITYNLVYGGQTYTSQTAAVKAVVQANAMGFLAGATGANYIDVSFYSPVSPFGKVTGSSANMGGNIIMVSIQAYNWNWIVPMWRTSTPLSISAISADRLENLPAGTVRPTP
jgi:Flp pilus assembly protein TadG